MAVHQVTPGCSKAGGVGNSSPSLSDSRYPVDRFTPVLSDCPFSDYMLTGGCAWGRCEIVALCHVPSPVQCLWGLNSSCNQVTKSQLSPLLPLLTLLGTATKSSRALTVLWGRHGLLVTLLYWHAKFMLLAGTCSSWVCPLFLCWIGLFIITH